MRRGIEPCDGVLRHQNPAGGHVRRRRAVAPAIARVAGAVVEGSKDEFGALVGRCFGKECNDESGDAGRVQEDGGVVEVAKDVHAKGVGDAVRDEERGVYADSLGRGGCIGGLDSCGCGDEAGEAECYAGCYGDLAEEVEPRFVSTYQPQNQERYFGRVPASYPRSEGGVLRRREYGGPEVRTAASGDGGDDLSHPEGDDKRKEGDDDPADAHDSKVIFS